MTIENANAGDAGSAQLICAGGVSEEAHADGFYAVECFDKDGNLKWTDVIENVVCTAGKNVMLDAALAGSAYTVVGPFMGLISSTSFSAVAAADTMASHAGWLEAGTANAPTYSGTRKTVVFSAASAGAKATSAALTFTFTGSGTVKGCFVVFFTSAVNTIDSTAGTLWSAGLFSGGDRIVVSTDVINVTYTASL